MLAVTDDSGFEHGILARLVSGTGDQLTTGTIPQRQAAQVTAVNPLPARSQVAEPAL